MASLLTLKVVDTGGCTKRLDRIGQTVANRCGVCLLFKPAFWGATKGLAIPRVGLRRGRSNFHTPFRECCVPLVLEVIGQEEAIRARLLPKVQSGISAIKSDKPPKLVVRVKSHTGIAFNSFRTTNR